MGFALKLGETSLIGEESPALESFVVLCPFIVGADKIVRIQDSYFALYCALSSAPPRGVPHTDHGAELFDGSKLTQEALTLSKGDNRLAVSTLDYIGVEEVEGQYNEAQLHLFKFRSPSSTSTPAQWLDDSKWETFDVGKLANARENLWKRQLMSGGKERYARAAWRYRIAGVGAPKQLKGVSATMPFQQGSHIRYWLGLHNAKIGDVGITARGAGDGVHWQAKVGSDWVDTFGSRGVASIAHGAFARLTGPEIMGAGWWETLVEPPGRDHAANADGSVAPPPPGPTREDLIAHRLARFAERSGYRAADAGDYRPQEFFGIWRNQ